MILNPEAKDIYSVETDLIDDKGTIGNQVYLFLNNGQCLLI
jgi:hypothetical protein